MRPLACLAFCCCLIYCVRLACRTFLLSHLRLHIISLPYPLFPASIWPRKGAMQDVRLTSYAFAVWRKAATKFHESQTCLLAYADFLMVCLSPSPSPVHWKRKRSWVVADLPSRPGPLRL